MICIAYGRLSLQGRVVCHMRAMDSASPATFVATGVKMNPKTGNQVPHGGLVRLHDSHLRGTVFFGLIGKTLHRIAQRCVSPDRFGHEQVHGIVSRVDVCQVITIHPFDSSWVRRDARD